ncbi:hypothetical protein DL769_007838 [Monosporascus sp. CRB-8-3]|nr:hypothetical protein DL769_007838 [Monosporascus sp. CRB-8-3]
MAPSAFPQDLPPRPSAAGSGSGGSWKDRNCPGFRTCLWFDWDAYNLAASDDKAVLARRVCQWVVLAIYAALGVLGLVRGVYGANVVGWVVGAVIVVIAFFCMGHFLAGIGRATGRRKVLGRLVDRWHFDVFLAASALVFVGLLVANFIHSFPLGAVGYLTTWYGMWVLIVLAWWITTWSPEPESYV